MNKWILLLIAPLALSGCAATKVIYPQPDSFSYDYKHVGDKWHLVINGLDFMSGDLIDSSYYDGDGGSYFTEKSRMWGGQKYEENAPVSFYVDCYDRQRAGACWVVGVFDESRYRESVFSFPVVKGSDGTDDLDGLVREATARLSGSITGRLAKMNARHKREDLINKENARNAVVRNFSALGVIRDHYHGSRLR